VYNKNIKNDEKDEYDKNKNEKNENKKDKNENDENKIDKNEKEENEKDEKGCSDENNLKSEFYEEKDTKRYYYTYIFFRGTVPIKMKIEIESIFSKPKIIMFYLFYLFLYFISLFIFYFFFF
jgi:hypothetical protein